jgi:hypothetical protein
MCFGGPARQPDSPRRDAESVSHCLTAYRDKLSPLNALTGILRRGSIAVGTVEGRSVTGMTCGWTARRGH